MPVGWTVIIFSKQQTKTVGAWEKRGESNTQLFLHAKENIVRWDCSEVLVSLLWKWRRNKSRPKQREKRQRKIRTEKYSDAGEDAVVRDSIPAEEIQTEIMINYSRSNICTTIIVVDLFWLTKLKRQTRRNEKSWKSTLLRFLRTLKKLNTKCSENSCTLLLLLLYQIKEESTSSNLTEVECGIFLYLFFLIANYFTKINFMQTSFQTKK